MNSKINITEASSKSPSGDLGVKDKRGLKKLIEMNKNVYLKISYLQFYEAQNEQQKIENRK